MMVLEMRSLAFIFLFSAISFDVIAASATATGVATVYKDAMGVTRVAEVMTKMSSLTYGTKYALQRVGVSTASMGRMAARAVGGPWGSAIIAGMAIYSYVYDEQVGAFRTSPDISCPSDHTCEGVKSWFANIASCSGYPDISSAFKCGMAAKKAAFPASGFEFKDFLFVGNPLAAIDVYATANGLGSYKIFGVFPSSSNPSKPSDPQGGQLISANDVGKKVFDGVDDGSLSSTLPRDLANDSVSTGNHISDWPELRDRLSDLTDGLVDADTPEVENPFTPTDESAFRDPEDRDELSENASPDLEFPTDYNREITQLAIESDINSIKQKLNEGPPVVPPDLGADVPLIDWQIINLPDLDDSQFDSISAGGCPADISLSVLGQFFSISYQPFCDLAIRLNPFFVALGWLSAAFIVFGGKSIV